MKNCRKTIINKCEQYITLEGVPGDKQEKVLITKISFYLRLLYVTEKN